MLLPTVNWRAETRAAHSQDPGEVLGLIQCPCDRGSACPSTRLPLLLFSTLGSHQTWEGRRQGEEDNLLLLPLSKIQLSLMHTVSLSLTGKYGVASQTPQVFQSLTNLDMVAR